MYVKTSGMAAVLSALWMNALAPANAQTVDDAAGLALAQRQACMACHQVDSKRVGPPLSSIGKRYAEAGDRDATLRYLAEKIRDGGRGVWGAVPMPAQRQVSEADALELAQWILSLAPATPQ